LRITGGKRNQGKIDAHPAVSIITVVYNSRAFIANTIQSVLKQECEDYEYLVVDGGSDDGTLDIIKEYDESIDHWISEPDKGIYDAMNKGLAMAKGKYIWFINSGDEVHSSKTLFNILNTKPDADIYFGESDLITEDGRMLGNRSSLSTRKLPEYLSWKSLKYGMVVSHQSILVRRAYAPFYEVKYKCSADINWVIESLKKSRLIVNCHQPLSKYLTGGFSYKNAKKCWKERFAVFLAHYGLPATLFSHIIILLRGIYYKLSGKSNY
jgi:glycosyltransferase involved in cell wall biosynthesis